MNRTPWFAVHAVDELTATDVLSVSATGLYLRLRCILWPVTGGSPMKKRPAWWAGSCGVMESELTTLLGELERHKLAKATQDGDLLCVALPGFKDRAVYDRKAASEAARRYGHATASPRIATDSPRDSPTISTIGPPTVWDGTERNGMERNGDNQDGVGQPSKPPSADVSQADEVFDHYRKYHPRSHPGEDDRKRLKARLKDGYSVADLCEAIDGCHRSPFHSGVNEKGTKYQSLELILRDSKHVAEFIELAKATPTGPMHHSEVESRSVTARLLARINLTPEVSSNGTK